MLMADRAVADICRLAGLRLESVPVFTEDGRIGAKSIWVDTEEPEPDPEPEPADQK